MVLAGLLFRILVHCQIIIVSFKPHDQHVLIQAYYL